MAPHSTSRTPPGPPRGALFMRHVSPRMSGLEPGWSNSNTLRMPGPGPRGRRRFGQRPREGMTEARNAPSDHTPPDLWGRLALLDRSCHLVIENIYTPDKAGPRWSVTVKPRTGADEPFQFKGD